MKRRPHKIVSVVLLAVLIAGMGMACRIQSLESRNKRWTENTETAGKILTESGKKEAQKQTDGTENDAAAQKAGVRGWTGRTLCQIGGADGCGQRPGIVREGYRCGPSDGKYNEDHDVYPCVGILAGTSGSDDRSIGSGCVPAEGTSWDAERGSVLHQRPVVFSDAGIA